MPAIAKILLKLFGSRLLQEVVLVGLEEAAKRSTTTVDDRIVEVVRNAFNNRVDPFEGIKK